MKSITNMVVALLMVATGPTLASAEPIAAKAPLNSSMGSYRQMMCKQLESMPAAKLGENERRELEKCHGKDVPSKESVGLPAYPGSLYITKSWGSGLSSVSTVSEDSPETVKAWYKKQLKGWYFDSQFDLFYEGVGKGTMVQILGNPSIAVKGLEKDSPYRSSYDIPKAETMITISYKPKK